jgi:hypothetical protein
MRYLLLLLAIPFLSVKAAGPDCIKLKQIAGELEKTIQTKRFTDCEKMDPKEFTLPDFDYRCKDLSAIDAQLKSIENEIALLNGIASLTTEIKDGLVTLKKFEENPAQAQKASVSLVKNLNVATSLERFLATTNTKSENILSAVAADKAGWTDRASFIGLLRKYCGAFPQKGTVCEQGFDLSEETFKEINDFVIIGKDTKRKFDKSQIKDLKNALEVTKVNGKGMEAGKIYSFGQLALELKDIKTDGLLSAEHMQVIKNLPELSNSKKFNFIKEMKDSIEALKGSEGLMAVQGIPSRFTALLNDLKNRQEWEMKSKVSLVLNQYEKDYLPAESKDQCDKARALEKGSIAACLNPLAENKGLKLDLKSYEYSAVGDLITEFVHGEKHITKLDNLLKLCMPKIEALFAKQEDPKAPLTFPAECEAEGDINMQLIDLAAKSQILNALKAKHIQSSPDLFTFRNFALEKLHSGGCMNSNESNITCDKELGNISKEAITLSDDASDIIHVFTKPKDATVIAQLCLESKEANIPGRTALCEIKDEVVVKKSENNDSYEAPVSPENSNRTGQAWFDLGSSILNSVAGYLAPKPMAPINPYGPVYPYEQPMYAPQDISSKIMDPYLSHGFGNYYSTPGVMPYSSLSSGGTASSYDFSGGSHFNSPIGW